MLSTRIKVEIAAAILGLVIVAILAGSWLGSREDQIRLNATLEAQKSIIAAADKRQEERADALKTALSEIEDLKKHVQTPAQVVQALPQVLPLPQPITLSLPAALAAGAPPAAAGIQPGQSAVIPAADLKPLFDFAADCKECKQKLSVAVQDKADDAVKIKGLTRERDEAVAVAKGGTKWQRIKRAGKWFIIGAAAGTVAVKLSGH